MGKFIRIFIAIVVVLSFLIWAKSDPAGAANPGSTGEQSIQSQADPSVSADQDDCQKGNNKNKEKCKCKENGKPKKHCGTVEPPDDDQEICEPGDFSVGGVAVLEVKKVKARKGRDDCFHAQVESSEGIQLPKNAGAPLTDTLVLTALEQGSVIKVCFAAPPGKQVKIYVSWKDSWKPVGTQVKNGVACASVPSSGSYVLGGT